jgi:hypothetical protein
MLNFECHQASTLAGTPARQTIESGWRAERAGEICLLSFGQIGACVAGLCQTINYRIGAAAMIQTVTVPHPSREEIENVDDDRP